MSETRPCGSRKAALEFTDQESRSATFDEARSTRGSANVEGYRAADGQQVQGRASRTRPIGIDTPARAYVLRRKPFGELLPRARGRPRVYASSPALHADRLSGAAALRAVHRRRRHRREFYVMEHGRGPEFWDGALPGSRRDERRAIYEAMIDTLAALHSSIRTTSGSATSASRAIISSARSGAGPSSIAPRETETMPEMERLIEWLPATLPEQDRAAVVHGDYRIDNMIFDAGRAAGARGARLGAVDARRSDGRFLLSR